MSGTLAVDTNAVIAYREGIVTVCTLIEAVSQLVLTLKIIVLFGFKALSGLLHHSILNCRTASIEGADILFLPVVVLGELLCGALNSAKPKKNEQAVHKFSTQSVLVPIDEAIAIRYATARLKLKNIGHPIPENDTWIGATCLELGISLLTRDGHFDYIHDLDVINWEKL